MRGGVSRSLLTSTLVVALHSSSLWGKTPQGTLDPSRSLPSKIFGLSFDPYRTGIGIGDMYRPHGNIRKVTWYEGSGLGGREDPAGWEKRVVQSFDEQGSCIEVESWAMGFCEFRRVVPAFTGNDSSCEVCWDYSGDGSCWRRDVALDASGNLLATTQTELALDGTLPPRPKTRVDKDFCLDPSGAVREETSRDERGSVTHHSSWDYDEHGRVRRHVSESCPRGPELTEEFEFDSSSRVVARVGRVRDDPHVYRSEFEYDDAGNVLVQREAIDGVLDSTWMCEYDSRGRLLSRYTFDLHVDPTRNRRASQRIEETFDGIDRPLIKRIYDLRGKLEDVVIWDYVFDDRGNWIRKTDFNIPVMRKIEYAD